MKKGSINEINYPNGETLRIPCTRTNNRINQFTGEMYAFIHITILFGDFKL